MAIKLLSIVLSVVALAVACVQVGQVRALSRRIEGETRRLHDLRKRVNR